MTPARTDPRGRVTHALGASGLWAMCGAGAPGGWRLLAVCEVQCPRCLAAIERREAREAAREARREAARLAALDTRTPPLFPWLHQAGR